ncbi:pyridoxal phosphate-dependent decarboxylase family protein [Streptomyces sclerotialus]|uniref:pyridoxal phosphate-dependent decarboxylase family protein n=1 Tax=Streptomyces sclerotialus TaxID=1957 RepID=UPI00099DC7EC
MPVPAPGAPAPGDSTPSHRDPVRTEPDTTTTGGEATPAEDDHEPQASARAGAVTVLDAPATGPAQASVSGTPLPATSTRVPAPAAAPGPTATAPSSPALAGGRNGPRALRPLLDTVLDALETGAAERGGPLPAGGPETVADSVQHACAPLLPDTGAGPHAALSTLVRTLAAGAADPADPHCAAHLHCPPLALATAADLAASALNPSMDSWDQAPAASELEALTTRALAELVHPHGRDADALVTTGGTESNQLAVLLAREHAAQEQEARDRTAREREAAAAAAEHTAREREATREHAARAHGAGTDATRDHGVRHTGGQLGVPTGERDGHRACDRAVHGPDHPGRPHTCTHTLTHPHTAHPAQTAPAGPAGPPLRVVCGANAHHSIHRAAWLLGLPAPVTVPTPDGTLDPGDLAATLERLDGQPLLVVATAGTTDSGAIDPLPALADTAAAHRARFHVDAAYGGPLLFSDTHRHLLTGLDRAHTVTLDLHKLGWQPVAAGFLAVPDARDLAPLDHRADYLNADDDTEAGLPDLLGRSLRTTRRPDILKIAVTLKALGRRGIADLVDRTVTAARTLADLVEARPTLELHSRPTLTTVLFRPTGADDTTVATIRRRLLHDGHAVLGRATGSTGLWLKATLLNPHAHPDDLRTLLDLVEGHAPR